MLKSYFKIALRNLLKNTVFSMINIVGLSFSVACCLLLFFYARHEQSYDAFHIKKNRLFRLEMTNFWGENKEASKHLFSFLTKDNDINYGIEFPLVVATDMQNSFPEIESITAIDLHNQSQLIRANNQVFKEEHVLYSDENFFNLLSFNLIRGNAKNIFSSKNNIVISEQTGKKYFGNSDPMGKLIRFANDTSNIFTIAGIVENAPANSSVQYDLLLPNTAARDYEQNIKERFNNQTHVMIVGLKENVNVPAFQNKMNNWVKTYFTEPFKAQYGAGMSFDFNKMRWSLRPLADSHFNISRPWGHYTNAKNIYQLICLAVIILFLASLNYILLAISNAAERSQEIGVRKVMGAGRKSIIIQFWVETQLIIFIAVFIGLFLCKLFLPLFNNMIESNFHIHEFSWKEIILALLILSFALGILAGYYPALIISKMKPLSIMKSSQTFKINPRLSKVLVIVQYTTCVVLMIAAFVITKQMQYINNKDLGFDKEQVLMVENPSYDPNFGKNADIQLAAFTKTRPAITHYSAMNAGLTGGFNSTGFTLNGEQKRVRYINVDYNYFELLGLKLVQGRSFSESILTDTSTKINPIVVNETLFNLLGKNVRVGEYNAALESTIIGVVKDYHFESLSKKIEPQMHRLGKKKFGYFMFRIKDGNMQREIANIRTAWKKITNNYPFQYTFLDENIKQMYEPEMRWQKIIEASCSFAILIACMGLFGLSTINAANRKKEIGIRKILGANIIDIISSLSKSFLVIIIISIFIAMPLASWLMNRWLEEFAYRIHLSWRLFLMAGTLSLIIALITVSFQAIKAAMRNPIKSLRTE
ncbi:MAG: ABC transporter permease [Bacteroidetes bacterium]|nr:ABC transporter permease [Bacteroidota bacterium]